MIDEQLDKLRNTEGRNYIVNFPNALASRPFSFPALLCPVGKEKAKWPLKARGTSKCELITYRVTRSLKFEASRFLPLSTNRRWQCEETGLEMFVVDSRRFQDHRARVESFRLEFR